MVAGGIPYVAKRYYPMQAEYVSSMADAVAREAQTAKTLLGAGLAESLEDGFFTKFMAEPTAAANVLHKYVLPAALPALLAGGAYLYNRD